MKARPIGAPSRRPWSPPPRPVVRFVLALAAVAGLAAPARAAAPAVRFFMVTDTTPRSFEVIWLSGEPATAGLRLFEGPDCLNEIFTATITPFPTVGGGDAIVTAAQQKGVMVVKAADLQPDTEYCVRTVTTSLVTGQAATAPDPPVHVRTAKRTARALAASPGDPSPAAFSNDIAELSLTSIPAGAPTNGTLVLLKVTGAASPLSAFVGDAIDDDNDPGTPTTLALLDLNNLYDAATGESLDLKGDGSEEMSARVLGSPAGFVTAHARLVPADTALNEVVTPAPCRGAAVTACDGRLGDADADGGVTLADADAVRDLVVGLRPVLACMVCGDATWDFKADMKDALAIGQAAAGLRLLP